MTEEQSVAVETPAVEIDAAPVLPAEPAEGGGEAAGTEPAPRKRRRRGGRGRGKKKASATDVSTAEGPEAEPTEVEPVEAEPIAEGPTEPSAESADGVPGTEPAPRKRRRRGGRGRGRKKAAAAGAEGGAEGETAEAERVTGAAEEVSAAAPAAAQAEAQISTRLRRRSVRAARTTTRRRREPLPVVPRVTDKLMVITEHGERDQIAVLEGRELVQHYVTRIGVRSMVGNVYLGRVQNVLPGMQAAFVDIGLDRNAFLYVDDAVPYGDEADHLGPAGRAAGQGSDSLGLDGRQGRAALQ
mgnify:CR=1 FL=1